MQPTGADDLRGSRPEAAAPFRRSRTAWRPWVWLILQGLLFLILAVFSTFPSVESWRTAIPTGTEPVATVPMFNLWTIWWNADRVRHGFADYWNAPIYYPADDAFAFSEPQPVTALLAPVVWRAGPAPAANLYVLLSLTLNGVFSAWLIRRLTHNRIAGLCGGAMVIMLPFIHWQLGVYQSIPLWGVIWTIGALAGYGRQPTLLRGLGVGLALACAYWLSSNIGLFFVLVLLASGGWLLGPRLAEIRTWRNLAPGAVLCLLLVMPIVGVQWHVGQKHGFSRSTDEIRTLSLEPADYAETPWPQLFAFGGLGDPQPEHFWRLNPGNLKLFLAAFGVALGFIEPSLRRWTAFAVTFGTAAFILSLGLNLQIGSWHPYQTLINLIPGLGQVRNVFRFAVFVQLIVALLAAQTLAWSCAAWPSGMGARNTADAEPAYRRRQDQTSPIARPPKPRPRRSILGALVALSIGGVAAMEVVPPRQAMFELPSPQPNHRWIDWLLANSDPTDAVVHFPLAPDNMPDSALETTTWMYWQTIHHRRLVNGYSGHSTAFFERLRSLLSVPSANRDLANLWAIREGLAALAETGVKYCVIRHGTWSPELLRHLPSLQRVYTDARAEVDIYILRGAAERPEP